ncbi:hydrolase [Streptomyces sp. Mg1]|nr:hydrolase [Streptomyces sp. Mg1]
MTATVSFTIDSPLGPRTATVAYERKGAGEPLLLLHGIGHHLQAWHPVTDVLAGQYDVIAVDLPGFGASAPLPEGVPYDLATVAPALGALCAALGVDRPHVAGNSLGGLLALEMGRTGLARSVTALSPAGFWTQGERRYAFAALRAMRAGARALPRPALERLSRSAAGRAALTSSIYAAPGRRAPEAVFAETVAPARRDRFRADPGGGADPYGFTEDVPGAADHDRLGESTTGCCSGARGCAPSAPSRAPGWSGCRAVATSPCTTIRRWSRGWSWTRRAAQLLR